MNVLSYNTDPRYAGFYTSGEILKAIEEIAEGRVFDETSAARKLWTSPTVEQDKAIAKLAWQYASSETDTLYWGDRVAFTR